MLKPLGKKLLGNVIFIQIQSLMLMTKGDPRIPPNETGKIRGASPQSVLPVPSPGPDGPPPQPLQGTQRGGGRSIIYVAHLQSS